MTFTFFKQINFLFLQSIIMLCVFGRAFFQIHSIDGVTNPRVTIMTSVYKGDAFIREFLEDIVQQTIFNQCELLMIDANSPGSERVVIEEYMKRYDNIFYMRLDQDPGLYGVWNLAIELSNGGYLTNANLDDRFSHECYEIFANTLDQNPHIDLVCATYYTSYVANETFDQSKKAHLINFNTASGDYRVLRIVPANFPMWRKTMHERYGHFDTSYSIAGDIEMWSRALQGGARFEKLEKPLGLFYINTQGLSKSADNQERLQQEMNKIYITYNTKAPCFRLEMENNMLLHLIP